jgi:hypothetical protein
MNKFRGLSSLATECSFFNLKREIVIMNKLVIYCAMIILVSSGICMAAEKESFYQNKWCSEHNGQTEVMNNDRTRIDCLTETHAIEFDFAKKWYEAIGQSLHYSFKTGKKAGIALIVLTEKDKQKYNNMMNIIKLHNLPITVWVIDN